MPFIEPIKAFTDNYIWCIHNKINAIVVDPGDAIVVKNYLEQNKLNLVAILVTHHHKDHTGGVVDLKNAYDDLKIYSRIPEIATHLVDDGDSVNIQLLDNLMLNVIKVPGHTLDHIVFYNDKMLFCGDTLFSAGCGRVFEGTYEQMYQSLMKIRNLADDTLIYSAHEYTLKNIEFALTIEPHNTDLMARYIECLNLRAKDMPTLPVKLKVEKLVNPFLRCDRIELKNSLDMLNNRSEEVFAYIRELRNNF